jgi:RNA polymerase sigma factor (sigma-70 family)
MLSCEMTTNELLRRYVTDRSEAAFAELVSQHIDLVYSAALRQLNGDAAAAQDVTQAVFTDLARKAPSLLRHTTITGWLYTSTRYVAANQRRAEQRRRTHEQEAYAMNQLLQSAQPDPAWLELRPLLDEAMHELNASDREAVLLRYFERLPLAQVGLRLGLNENAARKRVERALEKLHAILAKRGVTSTMAALAIVLTERAVGAAPSGLARRISVTAVAAAAGGSAIGWTLLKLAAIVTPKAVIPTVAAILVVGVAVGAKLISDSSNTAQTRPEGVNASMSARAAASAGAGLSVNAASANENDLILHILDNDTGQPIPGAVVNFVSVTNGLPRQVLQLATADDQGVCRIPGVRDTGGVLEITPSTDGFVDARYRWITTSGERISRQYTLRLGHSVPIGGKVINEHGEPVVGAEVHVGAGESILQSESDVPHISMRVAETTITDATGHWRINRYAKESIADLLFQANHPDYAFNRMGRSQSAEITARRLAGSDVYVMHPGYTVRGSVLDSGGRPVSGATVSMNVSGSGAPIGTMNPSIGIITTSQPDGSFALNGAPISPNPNNDLRGEAKADFDDINTPRISAVAPGFVPTEIKVNVTNREALLRFSLQRGRTLRLRVSDGRGAPVTNYTVNVYTSQNAPAAGIERQGFGRGRDGGRLFANFGAGKIDAQGRIIWDGAPEGELALQIMAPGFRRPAMVLFSADGIEHQIALQRESAISGTVRNATTSKPIDRFRMVLGSVTQNGVTWGRVETFRDGKFSISLNNFNATNVLRIKFEADGFAAAVSPVVKAIEGETNLDIILLPSAPIILTVLTPDGTPATNADVGLDIPGALPLAWVPGGLRRSGNAGNYTNVFSTDSEGRFALPSDDSVTRVLAASSDGYGEATWSALSQSPVVRMQPWGRVEGRLLADGKPTTGRTLDLLTADFTKVMLTVRTNTTDAAGRFVFPKVPAGKFNLRLWQSEKMAGGRTVRFETRNLTLSVNGGETIMVSLFGYTLNARLVWPEGITRDPTWTVTVFASAKSISSPDETTDMYYLREGENNNCAAEDVPPGSYNVRATVGAPASKSLYQAEIRLDIPKTGPAGPVTLNLQPAQ